MSQPDPANNRRNTHSKAKSVPVGVKSKQSSETHDRSELSLFRVEECYHTPAASFGRNRMGAVKRQSSRRDVSRQKKLEALALPGSDSSV